MINYYDRDMLSFEELRNLRKEATTKKKKKGDRIAKQDHAICQVSVDFSASSGPLLGITEQNTQQGT